MLPFEVIQQIIDELAEDKRTLGSCALVSRSWTPTCRRHLFRVISIIDEIGSKRFLDSIVAFPERTTFLREARLLDGPWRRRAPVWFTGDYGVGHVIKPLKNIEVLHIQFLDFSMLGTATRDRLFDRQNPAFPLLTKLVLTRCSFFAYPSFAHFLNAFPCLIDLSLEGPHWAHPADHVPDVDLPLLKLRSLMLKNLRLSPFSSAAAITVAHRIDPTTLNQLVVHIDSDADISFFERFTTTIGLSIRCLRIYSSQDPLIDNAFSNLPDLNELTIVISIPFGPAMLPLRSVNAALSKLPSTKLRLVQLGIEGTPRRNAFPDSHIDYFASFVRRRLQENAEFRLVIVGSRYGGGEKWNQWTMIAERFEEILHDLIDGGSVRILTSNSSSLKDEL